MLFVKYFLRLLYTCCHKSVPVWVVLFLLTFLQSVVLLFSLGKWMRIECCMHWYLWISGLILILGFCFVLFLVFFTSVSVYFLKRLVIKLHDWDVQDCLRYPVFFTFLDGCHVVLTEEASLIWKKEHEMFWCCKSGGMNEGSGTQSRCFLLFLLVLQKLHLFHYSELLRENTTNIDDKRL